MIQIKVSHWIAVKRVAAIYRTDQGALFVEMVTGSVYGVEHDYEMQLFNALSLPQV